MEVHNLLTLLQGQELCPVAPFTTPMQDLDTQIYREFIKKAEN